jgi:aldehyde:ferredoxin oxidoreductase
VRHYEGPLLTIDVGARETRTDDIDDVLREFIGGRGVAYEDLLDVGARVVDLERRFNSQRGMDRTDDRLLYDLPEFEAALDEYYETRGWNEDGTVPEARFDSDADGPAVADD